MLKLIRVKSRLDQKDNDILINLFFMGRIQCEMQLSINEVEESDTRKSKYYSAYNHLLYELKRSLFGPIGEFACILGEHDPVVSQYVRMEKYGPSIKTTTGNQLSAKHPKLKEIK